jgi:glutaredoxin 3
MNITLYTLSSCPFCVRAKQLLDSKGLKYTLHEMDTKPAELAAAKKKYGHSTVPIVLIDDKLIGGNSELVAFAAKGGLG